MCGQNLATAAVACLALVLALPAGGQEKSVDLSTQLMESTYRVEGVNATGQLAYGTAFIMARPFRDDPTRGQFVLVTAAHVLEPIVSEDAVLIMRKRNSLGRFEKLRHTIRIRNGKTPLWTKHHSADVVVMYVALPNDAVTSVLSTNLLGGDQELRQFEIHPGDDVMCLGYPLGTESNDAGFPILRSGRIASYPILPTGETKSFLFDFPVFPGNSGGPVFLVSHNRLYGGSTNIGVVQMVLGIVIEQRWVIQKTSELYSDSERRYPLSLAVVAHASFIREALQILPEPVKPPAK